MEVKIEVNIEVELEIEIKMEVKLETEVFKDSSWREYNDHSGRDGGEEMERKMARNLGWKKWSGVEMKMVVIGFIVEVEMVITDSCWRRRTWRWRMWRW